MTKNEEFEKWAYPAYSLEKRKDGNYKSNETRVTCAGYEARQPEIDALKAELRMLRDGIQTMGDALADGVWAHLISSDDDLNALDAGISSVVGKLSTLKAEVEKLRADAERYQWLFADHDDKEIRNRRNSILQYASVTSYSSMCLNVDAAMKETK